MSDVKGTEIKSYLYIPAIKSSDESFSSLNDTVIVPIKYKYRNSFGEFGYFCNNDPLKCVAAFVWESHFPYLEALECPQWQFIYPKNKNIRCPAQKLYILDCILWVLPSKDIIECVLFPYLGYSEMEIVQIKAVYSNMEHNIAYFKRYKIRDLQKELFRTAHIHCSFQ